MYKSLLTVACVLTITFTTGCSTKFYSKKTLRNANIPAEVFSTCKKPTKITDDLGFTTVDDLLMQSDKSLNDKLIKAYVKSKNEHIACYKTVLNIHSTYLNIQKSNTLKSK